MPANRSQPSGPKCCGSVAALLRVLLHLKCLPDNDVADVAPFWRSYYQSDMKGCQTPGSQYVFHQKQRENPMKHTGETPVPLIPIPPKTARNPKKDVMNHSPAMLVSRSINRRQRSSLLARRQAQAGHGATNVASLLPLCCQFCCHLNA